MPANSKHSGNVLLAGSVSLVADSLDMLGDALVYGFSIYVLSRSTRAKAQAAQLKGGIMAAFGILALGQAVYRTLSPEIPSYEVIGLLGLMALAANGLCFSLLWRHRADDLNMRSVWLCSRNDLIANVAVILAGGGVWLTKSGWPDLIIGLGLAILFLRSAMAVLGEARNELRVASA